MPTRDAILASLKEDGYDVSWARLWRRFTWKNCDCCKRSIDGKVALVIEDRAGPTASPGTPLCLNRRECRKVRDGLSISRMNGRIEDVVEL